ncbi:hypothetical protein PHJA_001711800 [Phtheirospermum japonicum]|uniref:Uncharacterized protein n=1 Tax=Phtheirospermum japonicum TaxID=374723 RepID=A0A830C945_9LAMI|nr:hypothetical protein PHJA_001711800 [Phtheirospermum japonicum]
MRSDMKIRATVNSTARAPSAETSEHVLASPCTANESICFKENINSYKSESPKLCVEPLQMKRKKKGGGYNLRKSLAWDKAFFTEEGVLDPIELSVINGASCNGDEDQDVVIALDLYLHHHILWPANVNVGKAAGKDLKLPKVPMCATTTSSILKASCVKHNQITKPGSQSCFDADFNIQRNSGSKSFPKNLQNTLSASKASSLRPARYSDGNSGNSSSKKLPPVNMSPVLDDNADNSGSKMISEIMTPARPVNSSEAQQESTSFAVPFSRNAHVGGTTMHPSQNQPMKPSGLRMPSPSLSFFSQPKRSVFHVLPLRDKETDVCGSQKPENLRLRDNLRTPKIDNKIPTSAISSSKAISSSSECTTSSHVTAVEVTKPNMDQKPMQKIPYISKIKTGELQKNDFEFPSESRSREQVMDDKFSRKAIEGYREETCKLDYHQPQIDPSNDFLGETGEITDKDKNVLRTKERASEHLDVSQLNGSSFGGNASSNIEAFKHSRAKAGNSYFGSDHLYANLLNETAFTEVSTDILTGEVLTENAVFALSVGDCRNGIDFIPEVDDDPNQSGKDMEPLRNVESNTSDRLLPKKQLCLQNSQHEKNVEKLMFVFPDRKDGSKVMDDTKTASSLSPRKVMDDTKTTSSLSQGKVHDCNFDEDKMTGKLLVSTEFNFVDDSLSSENHSSLADVSFDRDFMSNTNVLLNNPANKNLSTSLHQDTQKTEIDYCSSFPESRTRQGSQENTLGKVTETGAIIQEGSEDNQLTSDMALKESESSVDNLRNLLDSRSVALQSTEINVLNEYCVKESERLTLPSSEFVADNVVNHNHGLHFENYLPTKCQADVSCVYNEKGNTEGSVTGQAELYLSTSTSSSFSANQTPLRDENCNDAYGIRGYTANVIPDLSRDEPFSETNESEVSGDINSSFSCLQSTSEHVKVEAASTPNNKYGDGLNDKSRLSVLPQNAIPFSDEWLAAIEAAGEDILTMKSGAVQNSPPDKSLPEPGPYSPLVTAIAYAKIMAVEDNTSIMTCAEISNASTLIMSQKGDLETDALIWYS